MDEKHQTTATQNSPEKNLSTEGGGGRTSSTPFPTLTARVRHAGNSWVFSMPLDMRVALRIQPGDTLIIRLVNHRAVVSRLDPRALAPVSEDERAASATDDARSSGV